MKLRDLEAQFICWSVQDGSNVHRNVETLAEATGIRFLCPVCFAANAGPIGTHSVICWFEDRVPDELSPGPGRWTPAGSGLDDLSFIVGKRSNSVQLGGGCNAHFFVTDGGIA